jgi:hypothetical protein
MSSVEFWISPGGVWSWAWFCAWGCESASRVGWGSARFARCELGATRLGYRDSLREEGGGEGTAKRNPEPPKGLVAEFLRAQDGREDLAAQDGFNICFDVVCAPC